MLCISQADVFGKNNITKAFIKFKNKHINIKIVTQVAKVWLQTRHFHPPEY